MTVVFNEGVADEAGLKPARRAIRVRAPLTATDAPGVSMTGPTGAVTGVTDIGADLTAIEGDLGTTTATPNKLAKHDATGALANLGTLRIDGADPSPLFDAANATLITGSSAYATDATHEGADVHIVKFQVLGKAVSGATNATPIEITTVSNHGLETGAVVHISGVLGNLAANGLWTITKTGAAKYTLDTSVGSGVYTSGGIVSVAATISYIALPGGGDGSAAWVLAIDVGAGPVALIQGGSNGSLAFGGAISIPQTPSGTVGVFGRDSTGRLIMHVGGADVLAASTADLAAWVNEEGRYIIPYGGLPSGGFGIASGSQILVNRSGVTIKMIEWGVNGGPTGYALSATDYLTVSLLRAAANGGGLGSIASTDNHATAWAAHTDTVFSTNISIANGESVYVGFAVGLGSPATVPAGVSVWCKFRSS